MVIGRVYKICTDEKYTDECYIGSTFHSLEHRFVRHKTDLCSSSILFQKFGYENCHIELIKEYDVLDREHLEVYETLWINKYRNKCVNKLTPFCIKKLWEKAYYEANKDAILEKKKARDEANRDVILEKAKAYREANKPAILERQKAYNEANKDDILERQKAYDEANKEQKKVYYETNRDAILERQKAYKKQPWTCEICNVTIRNDSKSSHLKTKKHQDNLSREQ